MLKVRQEIPKKEQDQNIIRRLLLRNVQIVDRSIRPGNLLLENGRILAELPCNYMAEAEAVLDGEGLYACAGLIEMHTHGAGGHDFMDGTPEAYHGACDAHLSRGVTSILPTTVAASREEYLRTLDAFRAAKAARAGRQCLLGMHFEGPYFPMQRAGGMDTRYITPPKRDAYLELIDYAEGNIARWTAAPELPGADRFGDDCVRNNILPSMGHTDANVRDVRCAMKHGFRHVTHLYSDMSTITRERGFRVLGVLECAFAFEQLWVEIIADGCHLPPDLLRMVYQLIGPDRLQLCSDSIRPAGLDADGKEVVVGSLECGVRGIIEDGVAKFMDRSAFYGSIHLGIEMVQIMVEMAGATLPDAVRMMTENPAKLLHLHDRKGRLLPGYDADVVLFDKSFHTRHVFCGGNKVI